MTNPRGSPVVLVEHRAHVRSGHWVTVVHQLTRVLTAEGYEVHVVTTRGLDRAGDPTVAAGAVVHQASWPWRSWTAAPPQPGRPEQVRTRSRRRDSASGALHQLALVASVRAVTRRLGRPVPVLVLTMSADPGWVSLLAPARADWTQYVLAPPPPRQRLRWAKGFDAVAARQSRRRARRGGAVRVRANHEGSERGWRARHPWLEIETAPMTGTHPATPTPQAEARRRLGLRPDGRLALAFGSAHPGKDLDPIVRAFAGRDAPARLLLAGAGMAGVVDRVHEREPSLDLSAIEVRDGPQTALVHHLAHSAADLVVLGFQAGNPNESGALMDAIDHGLPVCCSDDCYAGQQVLALGVGRTYPTGDSGALRAAVVALEGVRLSDIDVARLPLPTDVEVMHRLLPSLPPHQI